MVEQVTTYITANWVAWLFAGAYAILIALYKKEKQQHKEEREENKAVREGLQALLRQQIIDICLKYEERKEAPAWAKKPRHGQSRLKHQHIKPMKSWAVMM